MITIIICLTSVSTLQLPGNINISTLFAMSLKYLDLSLMHDLKQIELRSDCNWH